MTAPRRLEPRRRRLGFLPGSSDAPRSRRATAVIVALVSALIGAVVGAASAVAANGYLTSPPIAVQPDDFNPQGDIGAPQLMAGGCVIRFIGTQYMPTKHFNSSHICANVAALSINTKGQLVAQFARAAAVVTLNVEEDETLSARGILAGGSSGTSDAKITFYDTVARRTLDLNRYADRKRIGGSSANIWLSFIQVGPPVEPQPQTAR